MAETPTSATLFAFNVGFGDCFVLRFNYPNKKKRHVLIDFGTSSGPPKPRPAKYMNKVAKQIKKLCGESLDIVVATHRHLDHISGFSTNDTQTGPGDIIKSCKPKLILQPWTEHPRAARDATHSPDHSPLSMAFARSLDDMDRVATAMHNLATADKAKEREQRWFSKSERMQLSFLGENNIKNKNAVENLMAMGKNRYLCFGQNPGTSRVLPGVQIDVLGPPTLTQSEAIRKQRRTHEDEYWHLQAGAVEQQAAAASPLFPDHVNDDPPAWTRWGINQLREVRKESLFSIVRQLDKQMNNTSLILLFTVGDKSLLFSGDAQWENWSYALSQEDARAKLKTVDVYKVGHHGSLNATPKSLWELFDNRDRSGNRPRLLSVNSTKKGVHGHTVKTAVPRRTLVNALSRESDYHSTEKIKIKNSSTKFYKAFRIRF